MFHGFETRKIELRDAVIHLRMAGKGAPLLMLHGYPQTHVCWHAVAPALTEDFTVVLPDLRGYGESAGPEPDPEHRNYSKRAMAEDMVGVMAALGHESFHLAGHDRGARVAYRLALDHPEKVRRLAVLDIVPTLDVWEQMTWQSALATYHWPFLAVPAPVPEKLIGSDPVFYLHHLLQRWAEKKDCFHPDALAAYERSFRKPSVIAATCADYRAGASVDLADDRADREKGRRIACPVLSIWSRDYLKDKIDTPSSVWRHWAEDVSEVPLDCGHFLAEEAPAETAAALREFFSA